MSDQEDSPPNILEFSHAWMRRMEQKADRTDDRVDGILEILARNEVRMGRIERDVSEVKLDFSSFDARLVSFTTEMLRLAESLDGADLKLEALNSSVGKLDAKMDRVDSRVANLEGKLDISPAFEPNE